MASVTLAAVSSVASDDKLHCSNGALTGSLGLVVQALLAVIAFGALVVKRFCEPRGERRSWTIWFFDTSKQAIGAAVIHFANVFLSELFQGDPCTWYFISFLLDSSVGLLIICIGLKVAREIFKKKGYTSLLFGQYGHTRQCGAWAGQCAVYVLVVAVEKILMTGLVLFDFWKKVRVLILSPITNPDLELVIVMFIVPFIVNAFIFWVVDNYLKEKYSSPSARKASVVAADAEVLVADVGNSHEKRIRHLPFSRSSYSVVRSTNDSDSNRLLSFDDDAGFDADAVSQVRHREESRLPSGSTA